MNVADSAKLAAGLDRLGWTATDDVGEAGLVVLNTCVVRERSELRAVSRLGRMKVLKQKGAVCSEVADAMATAALKLTPADVAIAVTGVAGPEPDEDGNPVGLVFCSAARSNRRTVTVRHFFEDLSPDATIKATVEEALTLLEQCCQC